MLQNANKKRKVNQERSKRNCKNLYKIAYKKSLFEPGELRTNSEKLQKSTIKKERRTESEQREIVQKATQKRVPPYTPRISEQKSLLPRMQRKAEQKRDLCRISDNSRKFELKKDVCRHFRHPKKGEDAVLRHLRHPKKDQGQQDYKLAAERLEECKISEEQRPELPIVWA